MTKAQIFDTVKSLIEKIEHSKVSGIIKFESAEEKKRIEYVYKHIYPYVQLNLGCNDCVRQYLHFLQAWYEREYPIYLKSLTPSSSPIDANADTQTAKPISNTKGRKKGVKPIIKGKEAHNGTK